ncbi:MAG TPA: hypothetical protein VJR71_04760 [Pseudolabrys sp.]|nr:hypothetical protein [Pseudolabrys sp.]
MTAETFSLHPLPSLHEVTGSGPPVIFIHGMCNNHLTWWQKIPHFYDRFIATFPTFIADALAPMMANAKVEHAPRAGHSAYFQKTGRLQSAG